jgi:hypothetical protein
MQPPTKPLPVFSLADVHGQRAVRVSGLFRSSLRHPHQQQPAGVAVVTGWRLLPHDFPLYPTVYHYWRQWRIEGRWEEILSALRARERHRPGP